MGRNGQIRAWTMENGSNQMRVGFSVTGCKTAVQRNRVRRRIRSAVSRIASALRGFDTVLSAPASAAQADFAALSQDVEVAAAKAQRNWKSAHA
jgi:ribonuclease P protein component